MNGEENTERVILVAVCTGGERETQESLDELEELARTAGAVAVGRLWQNRETADHSTYIGSGKLEELSRMADELNAAGIICDDELSPAQIRGLEKALNRQEEGAGDHYIKIMDRTILILDIFASRAHSSEGKIQVELAQLRHRLMLLTGQGVSLSRLGGGIGTRGPGEKKLETDRRLIRNRISRLKEQLQEVQTHRDVLRSGRRRKGMPVAAIVGYTNAGKSTLLNALTGAHVLEEDKLFATLDPATRQMTLPDGQEILLTDTVGFIRKLPHHLVEAFKSTLEEARYADVILHVVDSANPQADRQMQVVYDTLEQLGISGKPVITLFNKQDKEKAQSMKDRRADSCLNISAVTGEGLDQIGPVLETVLSAGQIEIERHYDYRDAGKVALIRKYGRMLALEYRDTEIYVKAYVPQEIYGNV